MFIRYGLVVNFNDSDTGFDIAADVLSNTNHPLARNQSFPATIGSAPNGISVAKYNYDDGSAENNPSSLELVCTLSPSNINMQAVIKMYQDILNGIPCEGGGGGSSSPIPSNGTGGFLDLFNIPVWVWYAVGAYAGYKYYKTEKKIWLVAAGASAAQTIR